MAELWTINCNSGVLHSLRVWEYRLTWEFFIWHCLVMQLLAHFTKACWNSLVSYITHFITVLLSFLRSFYFVFFLLLKFIVDKQARHFRQYRYGYIKLHMLCLLPFSTNPHFLSLSCVCHLLFVNWDLSIDR